MSRTPTALHWSGGKDSSLALTRLLADDTREVTHLVTTVNPDRDLSTVHGIPVGLLSAQAASIGIALHTIEMRGPAMEDYLEVMEAATLRLRAEGVEAFAFGDLSASGIRATKEEQFGPLGIEVVEPLWGLTSREAVEAFLTSGLRAVTVVVDADVLGPEHVGVELDRGFVDRLPPSVDPAGELGEYHSFTYAGPIYREPVAFRLDEPFHLTRDITTTEGVRRYQYWLATPR